MRESLSRITLNQLITSTQRYDSKRVIRTPDIDVTVDNIIPYFGTKSILYSCTALSGTTNRKQYRVIIACYDIEFKEVDKFSYGFMKFEGPKGELIQSVVPEIRKTPVRIYCTCDDYYFTFAWWNFRENCYYGRQPRRYRRKTTTAPQRNPDGRIGMCKHCINTMHTLSQQKLLK